MLKKINQSRRKGIDLLSVRNLLQKLKLNNNNDNDK